MKKSRLDFLKILIGLAIIVLINSKVLSLNLNEILEKSKSDPEFAWNMYLIYISQVSNEQSQYINSDEIDKVGKKIYAKRKLVQYKFALDEDVDGLIDFLKTNAITEKTKYLLLDIFDGESLSNYLLKNLKNNIDSLYLLKIIRIPDKDQFSKSLMALLEQKVLSKKFFETVLPSLPQQIKDELLNMIIEEITNFVKNKNITNEEKISLANVYKDILKYYPSYKNSFIERRLKLNKNILVSIWEFLIKFSFSTLSNIRILITILLLVALLISFSLRIIRYRIFLLLGLKKLAALSYKKIVEKDPLNEEKRLKLAQLYESAGMFDEALNEYNFLKRIKFE
ncbi:hypothetical protein [Fervidobacterium nodosum]|uniref:hypothetical protein n=1 Tax=Fervidobacterium nodosum TaxID=2424 RepID=UPI0000E76787|nr:hypothetical protein [Fervidobacterium nodosum]